jgi:hypothetical protein
MKKTFSVIFLFLILFELNSLNPNKKEKIGQFTQKVISFFNAINNDDFEQFQMLIDSDIKAFMTKERFHDLRNWMISDYGKFKKISSYDYRIYKNREFKVCYKIIFEKDILKNPTVIFKNKDIEELKIGSMIFQNLPLYDPWVSNRKGQIILYTRPYKYSKTNSPDIKAIQNILDEQNQCIRKIIEKTGSVFSDKVKIYLYNYDEAEERIGTNSGGHAEPNDKEVLDTYFEKPYKEEDGSSTYLGLHEMVHVICENAIGRGNTRLFIEGYANAIDGYYGSYLKDGVRYWKKIGDWIGEFSEKNELLTISELIFKKNIDEKKYYTQSGIFIQWLFKKFGVAKINELYILSEKEVMIKLEEIFNKKFSEIEKEYQDYLTKSFKKS